MESMDSNKRGFKRFSSLTQLDAAVDPKKRKASPAKGGNEASNSDGEDKSYDRDKMDLEAHNQSGDDSIASFKSCEEVVRSFNALEPLPEGKTPTLKQLTASEKEELEKVLGIGKENHWRDDWAGTLSYVDEEIQNPDVKGRKKQSFRQPLLLWASNNSKHRRLIHNLIRMVVNMKNTPAEAKRILSLADPSSVEGLEKAIRRTCYDPIVLKQDGWETEKAGKPQGATGGAYWIGDMVRWQGSDAVVLAFVYDAEIGDLWKVAWIEDGGLITFDMEAEELSEARKKWIRRQIKPQDDSTARKSSRFATSENFSVAGVEEGIVLASSLCKHARQGVYWPARVVHASENVGYSQAVKRSMSKQKVELVFLAPYWDSEDAFASRGRKVEGLSENGPSTFYSGALFQVELCEAALDSIQPYPFDPEKGIDIEQLRNSFRFTGLPKSAFSRFLDSHRLALALKLYARKHTKKSATAANIATAGLFESHPIAVKAPIYPSVVLHLPYSFILSQLPSPESYDGMMNESESVIQLANIVDAMKPPISWGASCSSVVGTPDRPISIQGNTGMTPSIKLFTADVSSASEEVSPFLPDLLYGLKNLEKVVADGRVELAVKTLLQSIAAFLRSVKSAGTGNEPKVNCALAKHWATIRRLGEDTFCSINVEKSKSFLHEWNIASERLYRLFVGENAEQTLVVTDWRCNGHITSGAAFERCVRLPAALKGARLAGLGTADSVKYMDSVPDEWINYVELKLLTKAHSTKYLDKMKARCVSVSSDNEVIMLTEDSEGNGGEDTRGSRGTWKAAVSAVAAAVVAVDHVMRGEYVNAFCATRPPGHHAGRYLHPMKAVSNGFCVLNAAACAAIHATTPTAEGGAGLGRVCVIDFDVHHGNGTQDILCSTYDPRFLYISIHAGGSNVNGPAPDEDLNGLLPIAKGREGIYPGKCGDTSPHPNVLNIPLGGRVTSHAVGTALINQVSPTVEAFSPNLIILSAGFDAHKHDPMRLGLLSAEDFGHITEVACQLAFKSCSGRVVSILEGGYGIPCCRPQKIETSTCIKTSEAVNTADSTMNGDVSSNGTPPEISQRIVDQSLVNEVQSQPLPLKIFDLGDDLPIDMDDQVPPGVHRRLEKCHLEGFVDCVKEHVRSLMNCNTRQ